MTHKISFPGLGLKEFTVDANAITIGNVHIQWYGILITLGMILAVFYVAMRARQRKISFDSILDLAIFVIVFGVIGARLFYVLTRLHEGMFHNFLDWFKIWEGGLAIYGGIIGGGIAAVIVLLVKKIDIPTVLDFMCPAVLIGQILGRWGNFFNCEAYGSETTLPWGMGIYEGGRFITVHPTFLYESLWNLIGFSLLCAFYKKKKYDGEEFFFTAAWYGFGRMLIELLRTDSLYICSHHAWYTKISVLIGFCCFLVGMAFLVVHRVTKTDFFFRKTNGKIPADEMVPDKLADTGLRALQIGIPVVEAVLMLVVVLMSVFQNL